MAELGLRSVFKRVRFPKYAPISYQKMVQMSLNDQYLKDTMHALPTGIVKMVNYGGGAGLNTLTAAKNAALQSETFTLNEENRLLKITYHTTTFSRLASQTDASDIFSIKNELFYIIDEDEGNPIYPAMSEYGPLPVIVPMPITSGKHTIEVRSIYWSGSPTFDLLGTPYVPRITTTPVTANNNEDFLLIEDLGSYISPGSSVEEK